MSGQRIDLAALRELAKSATKGPWQADDRGTRIEVSSLIFHVCEIDTSYDTAFAREQCEADAELIAAMSPDAVLALVEAVEAARDLWDHMHPEPKMDGGSQVMRPRITPEVSGRFCAALASFVFGEPSGDGGTLPA